MARAGLLESPARGKAEITVRGRELLAEGHPRIDNSMLSRFSEFTAWKDASGASDRQKADDETKSRAAPETSDKTPEEQIEAARQEHNKALRAELLDRVRSMTPAEFEELIIQLLLRMGYGSGAEEMAEALGGLVIGALMGSSIRTR